MYVAYKSLTTTKYSELERYETLKRVASANAILKHYKSSLKTVKRHAIVLSCFCFFFKKKPFFSLKVVSYIDSHDENT